MRFFLGFDGVPVVLPLLSRPDSTEPWRAIRESCRQLHKLSACVVGHEGRQHRDQEALWDFPHNHIQVHITCTLMYPFPSNTDLKKKWHSGVHVRSACVRMTLEATF